MNAASQPLVSIVIATQNARDALASTLAGLTQQEVPRDSFEIVVVDGASDDGTVTLLESSSLVAWWISEPDTGVYQAWNRALRHVRGDWIYFLGAGDHLANPTTLQHVCHHLRTTTNEAVSGKVRIVDGPWAGMVLGGPEWRRSFHRRMSVPHQGFFARRALFELYGPFDETFRIAGDYEWLLRIHRHVEVEDLDMVVCRMDGDGLSATRVSRSLDEFFRAQLRHRPMSAWVTSLAAWAFYRTRHAWQQRRRR